MLNQQANAFSNSLLDLFWIYINVIGWESHLDHNELGLPRTPVICFDTVIKTTLLLTIESAFSKI